MQTDNLVSVLSSIKKYSGETFVIKIPDIALRDPEAISNIVQDIVLLNDVGINLIIIHGGSTHINIMLDKLGIESTFIDGQRITNHEVVEVIEMVLSGKVNKEIVSLINDYGGNAVGISGKDGNLVEAKKIKKSVSEKNESNIRQIIDFGYVGEPSIINPDVLIYFEESGIIPVISPIAKGEDGETFSIKSDNLASILASAMIASKLILLIDSDGIIDNTGTLIKETNIKDAIRMLENKMVKAECENSLLAGISAIENAVEHAHIVNYKLPHILLSEIFTSEKQGTLIYNQEL